MSEYNRGGLTLGEIKEDIFDPVLAQMMFIRVVHGAQITEYFRYRPIVDRLIPILVRLVDPDLLKAIINKDQHPPFDVYAQKRRIYVPEDRARSCLSTIVAIQHGRDDKALISNVTESSMNLLLKLVHSNEFLAELATVLADFDIPFPSKPPKTRAQRARALRRARRNQA